MSFLIIFVKNSVSISDIKYLSWPIGYTGRKGTIMTKAEMKEFKKMFGKYCRDQINKGNCTEDTCEWCSIQAAYNEVKRFEKINSTITVRIYNIKWDIDEEDYSNEENEKLNLPNEVTHTFYEYNDINDEDLLDEIADWLSDEYGFCVSELEVEEVEGGEED